MITSCSPRMMFIIFCAFSLLVTLTIAQPDFWYHSCSEQLGNYTTNSTYQENLNGLLSSISSNTEINYGFYNFSSGQNRDRVNAIALCRGDVALDDCRSCLNDSVSKLPQICPNQKEATGWYYNCMLRYSSRSIFGTLETSGRFWLSNPDNASSIERFNQALSNLLDGLRSRAASGSSLRKFAAGNASAPDSKTLYALVQCTPDLSEQQCADCLVTITGDIPTCCGGKEGGRVVTPSCNLRFELYRFYESTADNDQKPPSQPPLLSPPPRPSNNNTNEGNDHDNISRTVIVVVFPVASFMILIITICIIFRVKNFKEKLSQSKQYII